MLAFDQKAIKSYFPKLQFFRFNSGSVKLIHTLGKDKKDTI